MYCSKKGHLSKNWKVGIDDEMTLIISQRVQEIYFVAKIGSPKRNSAETQKSEREIEMHLGSTWSDGLIGANCARWRAITSTAAEIADHRIRESISSRTYPRQPRLQFDAPPTQLFQLLPRRALAPGARYTKRTALGYIRDIRTQMHDCAPVNLAPFNT